MAKVTEKVERALSAIALIMGTAEIVGSVVKKTIGKFNDRGEELVDGRPMEPPVGYVSTPTIAEQIALQVRAEAQRLARENAGVESFEEQEDFDVGEDLDPSSPYEAFFEPITEARVEELVRKGYIVREHVVPPHSQGGAGGTSPPSGSAQPQAAPPAPSEPPKP